MKPQLTLFRKFSIVLTFLVILPYFLSIILSVNKIVLLSLWVLSVTGSIIIVFYFYRRVIKPVEELSRIATSIAGGESRLVPRLKGNSEIVQLYNSVRLMDENMTQDIRKLKEANRLKSEFLSIASHQLRTPLSSIKWLIEVLLENNKNMLPAQQEKLQDIYRSNERLINLVNDLLNAAKLEEGVILAKKQPTDIEKIIKDEIQLCKIDTEAKKLTINFIKEGDVKEIQLDPVLFSQAVRNLLDNAVAYSPNGSVIDVTITTREPKYIISVHNEGPGIPEMEHDKLFTKFYRGYVAQKLRPEGSGLGLFIAKLAVEANGGSIWFESPSHDGGGVTFYISVPIE